MRRGTQIIYLELITVINTSKGGEEETEGEINECSLSSSLINLISGVTALRWREDEMVEDADEKTARGCATRLFMLL